MARGSEAATTAATTAGQLGQNLQTRAGGIYDALAPQLMSEAAHPPGFAPTDLAAMNTGVQQSAGGGQGAAVGQGALLAARTRNAGGADAAIASAARTSGQNLSKAAVGVQTENANLKAKQMQEGLSGLSGLYGGTTTAGIQSTGQIAPDINADTNAENASWDWTKGLDSISRTLNAGAGLKGAFG